MNRLPARATTPMLGHLWRWTRDPVRLLRDGARGGPVFQLRLWRPVVVGYRPDWNRAILGDLDTFRSRGSLSDLTPYLSAGLVHSDVPEHDHRRRELNPSFHARALEPLTARLEAVVERSLARPRSDAGRIEALEWSGQVVRRMLNAAFFDGRLPDRLLAEFYAPLDRPNPAPLLRRPRLFRRLDAAITKVLADLPSDTLGAALAGPADAVEEIRVALAAGYDTTAHTLAWALWHVAGEPDWRSLDVLPLALDETLRLYPAGWLGSRIVRRDTSVSTVELQAGTMVLYSPLLTHRDPELWRDPDDFRPDRFYDGRPAWGFLPFSAGRRTCLGASLARLMLRTAVTPFCNRPLRQVRGDARISASITLRPIGPLWLERG